MTLDRAKKPAECTTELPKPERLYTVEESQLFSFHLASLFNDPTWKIHTLVQRDAVACVEATAGKDESGLGAKLRASPSPSAAAMDDDTRPAGSVRERKAAQELAFNF